MRASGGGHSLPVRVLALSGRNRTISRTSSSPSKYWRLLSMKRGAQGHSPAERRTVAGKRDVAILELHPVGNYAVRIVFDDLHSTGIFS